MWELSLKKTIMGRHLFCQSVILLVVIIFPSLSSSTITGTITPSIPSAFVLRAPTTLTLNCTLVSDGMDIINASEVYFEFTNHDVKLKSSTEIIGDRIVRLSVSRIQPNMTSSRISCCYRNVTLDNVTIVIEEARFPEPPKCVVFNWKRMTCSWDYEERKDNMSISLTYSRSYGEKLYPCPSLRLKTCSWDSQNGPDQFFEASYTVGLYRQAVGGRPEWVENTITTYDSKNIVKPNPVGIEVVGNRSDRIELKLGSPNSEKRIMFRVAFLSRFSNDSIKSDQTSITLSNLIPNTEYKISIDCIPLVSVGLRKEAREVERGFWSDIATKEVTTAPDLPAGVPALSPGGFLVLEHTDTLRKIKLFIQPVDDILAHGDVKGYRVRDTDKNFLQETSDPSTNVILSLEMEEMYNVSVEMRNVKGYNESLIPEMIVIGRQSELPPFPAYFIVQTDDNETYFANWTLVDGASSYTLYWCSSNLRMFDCKNPLEWKILASNQTSEVLRVVALPDLILWFALSVEVVTPSGETISSGMWKANCTYSKSGELKPPEGAFVAQRSARKVTIEWTPPKCDAPKTRYASRYVIGYCPPQKDCNETVETVTSESFHGSVTIDDLEPDVDYDFTIWSLSENGESSAAVSVLSFDTGELSDNAEKGFPVGVVIFLLVLFVAVCAVPITIKFARWWKRKMHIDVKVPAKYVNSVPVSPSTETTGYSTFLRSDLNIHGQVQTTAWNCGQNNKAVHAYFNSAAFQPCEYESLLSRQNSEYQSSATSSEMSSIPSTQSNSAASKSSSSDPRRDSGISAASISGYNVVIEQPSETSGSSTVFLRGIPCDENAIATTEIC